MASNVSILVQAKDNASSSLERVRDSIKKLGADTRDTAGEMDRSSGSTNRFSGSLTNLGGVVKAIGLTYLAKQVFDLGRSAVTSAGEFEQSRIAFETMLGSAEKASGMMQDISKFAKETPFELPEVVQASKQLLAFGFSQEQILPIMKRIGDVSAGLGVPVGQLTTVFGQVRVAGRLMGQDLLQFTNAGVPMIEALAKTMGKPQEEIKKLVEKGEVGFDDVEAALNSLTDTGSKFGGMMDKQSQSFNGVVSNIQDGFGQVLRSAVGMDSAGNIVKGSFFDRIKGAAQQMMPALQEFANNVGPAVAVAMQWIDDKVVPVVAAIVEFGKQAGSYLLPKLEALWGTISNKVVPILQQLWKDVIEPLIPVFGTVLVGAIGLVVDVANELAKAFSWVVTEFQNGNPIVVILTGVFGGLAAAMAFNAVFSALTAGFSILTTVTIPAVMLKIAALQTLVLSPLVMPAIAVGAAIASIGLVIWELQKLESQLKRNKLLKEETHQADMQAYRELSAIINDGVSSQAAKDRAGKARDVVYGNMQNNNVGSGFAIGTSFAPGGRTLVGEHGPEIVNLPRGSQVIPNYRSRMDEGGGEVTNNYLTGTFNFSSRESVEEFFTRLDKTQRLARMGMAG